MKNHKIAIIGCGNLGMSILNGLVSDPAYPNSNITVTKRNIDSLSSYRDQGVYITTDNAKAIQRSEIIIVALKPYTILQTIEEFNNGIDLKRHILISVATGITIDQLQKSSGVDVPIFRAMPNTAANVKESITCISTNNLNSHNIDIVHQLFNKIGTSIDIEEQLMDAATVLGACGIAFVLRFIRAMIQGGIQIGFDAKTASAIVNQTIKGSAELLIQGKQHPEFEIDKVTTPKGCTIVGLNEMEHNGFSSALIKGINTSFEKI